MDDGFNADPDLQYRRLRAPQESGKSLQIPPLSHTAARWGERTRESTADVEVNGVSLATLRLQGRTELLQLATQYSRQYRDVDLGDRQAQSIVMSGHQPLLFHPGVWFKNFALSSLGAAVGAMPVNLVVDNDVCGPAAIKCPAFEDGKASTRMIEIDAVHEAVPYEVRPIVDEALFDSFPDRATGQVMDCLAAFGKEARPLVSRLWQHVRSAKASLGGSPSLGAVLAAGRHRLEQEVGLQSLEIPISKVAVTPAFAEFASSILKNQNQFNQIYNARLAEYRDVHGIRSNAHPVPELEFADGWQESPFWVWSSEQPQRKRLFVKCSEKSVTLTNRAGWQLETELSDLPSALLDLSEQQIAIRPRALITTLFCRLVLSDLFLHGIGGAKYDQLTDLIASDFFGLALPRFSTLTATMHLPFEYPHVTRADRSRIGQELRERKYHPERFADSKTASDLIARKRVAIENATMTRLQRHHEIEEVNRMLQPLVADQAEGLQQKLSEMSDQIHNSRILYSREYSFCLFDESLIEDLKRIS